jgi:hypothetical protein
MGIDSHLSTCVGTQSPKYLEMAQGHISLSASPSEARSDLAEGVVDAEGAAAPFKRQDPSLQDRIVL